VHGESRWQSQQTLLRTQIAKVCDMIWVMDFYDLCPRLSPRGSFGESRKVGVMEFGLIQFSSSPNVCFCTTCGKHSQQNITFYPMQYDCLINITCKNTFCLHFWYFGWHFIHLSIFQLPAVKLLEALANYANTGKEDAFSIHWQQYR